VYGGAAVASSAALARRAGWRDAAALPVVFAAMHLAWGAGFLAGALRFAPRWWTRHAAAPAPALTPRAAA
jgi:hypothetical protein